MRLSIISIFLAASLGSITVKYASADTTVSSTVQDIKTKFYELLGKDTATVAFKSGSSVLSESERQNLAAIVSAVRMDATVSSAIIAAWSDKEYPATKGERLSESERSLADARLAVIEGSLLSLGIKNVETHTMAQHPSWIGKLLNTKDAKVKGEGTVEDANDQLATEIGQVLRDKGGPNKAVIIIRRVGDNTAH